MIFNITITIFTSLPVHSCSVTLTLHLLTTDAEHFTNSRSSHLAVANDAKQQCRCEYERKRDGWCLVLSVSALWQSTGVAKAQKQIQTIPTKPHSIPSHGSDVSAIKPFTELINPPPSTPEPEVTCRWRVFAMGLSFIVHIKCDKDAPSSVRWSR